MLGENIQKILDTMKRANLCTTEIKKEEEKEKEEKEGSETSQIKAI